jgi:peroxiredoxin
MMTLKMTGFRKFAIAAAAAASMIGAAAATVGPDHDTAKVGHAAPEFTLTDLDGKSHKLSDLNADGKIVVLEWFNPECPYVVKHYDGETQTMNALAKEFKNDGVVWVRINSGAPGKPGNDLAMNKAAGKDWKIDGAILRDESGEVGKMYGAKRTPEMYIIDAEGILRYHGAIDDNPAPSLKGTETNHVRAALVQVLAGETVTTAETKAYGCGVKYAKD